MVYSLLRVKFRQEQEVEQQSVTRARGTVRLRVYALNSDGSFPAHIGPFVATKAILGPLMPLI